MVPGSVIGVVAFFLFVIPGTCYELLRRRIVLPIEESVFVQISRILLSGVLITMLTAVLLLLVRVFFPAALLDPVEALIGGAAYFLANPGLSTKTLILYVLISSLLAAAAGDLHAVGRRVDIHRGTALFGLTEVDVKPGEVAWLSVRLKSGMEVLGYYYGATTELDPDKRELTLQAPLRMGDPSLGTPVPMGSQWKRVLVPFREVEYMSVAYVIDPNKKPDRWQDDVLSWLRANVLRAWVCLLATALLLVVFAFPWASTA